MNETKKVRDRWARLSVSYHRDEKIIEAGPVGELAFIRLLALARESVEQVDVDGAVPRALARRELRDVQEIYTLIHPGTTFDDLVEHLVSVGLLRVEGNTLIVSGYSKWQTTRGEIEEVRAATRARVSAHRRRKAKANEQPDDDHQTSNDETPGGGEDNMGIYDQTVEAFQDLRDTGAIKKGTRKVGKHGLAPNQVADAERVVEHFVATRKNILGGAAPRISETWWADTRKLLNGVGELGPLTADQICDLVDYALGHQFWHAHCQTPGGLAKHAAKLYNSDEYVTWSKRANRPEANRPRNTLIGRAGVAATRGQLAADQQTDWSKVSGEL
jgi:hypothetical protein